MTPPYHLQYPSPRLAAGLLLDAQIDGPCPRHHWPRWRWGQRSSYLLQLKSRPLLHYIAVMRPSPSHSHSCSSTSPSVTTLPPGCIGNQQQGLQVACGLARRSPLRAGGYTPLTDHRCIAGTLYRGSAAGTPRARRASEHRSSTITLLTPRLIDYAQGVQLRTRAAGLDTQPEPEDWAAR